MDPSWLTALTALAVAVCGLITWFGRMGWRAARRISRFLDDYAGEPALDGIPGRPGFMARLASVEKSLAHVVQETSPNHGKSLRDIIIRAAGDVADIKQEQAAVRTRLEIYEQRDPRKD